MYTTCLPAELHKMINIHAQQQVYDYRSIAGFITARKRPGQRLFYGAAQ
jgi:hypothetical protein